MKKRSIMFISILVIGLGISISSCSEKVAFSTKVKTDYNLKESDLKDLQFQLVNDIVLTKSTSENTSILENGEIVVSENNSQDKVIFKSGIKGVFVKSIDSTKIAISFEKDDNHFIVFGTKNNTGIYVLQADEWTTQGRGKINYNGVVYYSSSESNKAYVTVKLRRSNRNITNQRLATGRKI